eukprot:scaffold134838_cov109-Attheya_sp.AAC.1
MGMREGKWRLRMFQHWRRDMLLNMFTRSSDSRTFDGRIPRWSCSRVRNTCWEHSRWSAW